ncbi:MAG: 3-hydroxyacyl-CoA dehydrogenase [Betaproteobacteria bacterium]|nr:3-hydroxyacyl-CoA dehydrogenase [Betaproteobacteria bacterium]MDH5221426.1 3-hydroxyacyl-CoA dehydrogenase [Betaproteobacteria bacterium]MDH5351763.1 3-hydroxyacyl-CoA dehydrogenase [Betaproteobacteria bacterium]
MLDPSRSDLTAGVAGSGTMGRGIVQVLAQCGARVRVFDAQAGAAAKAKDAIARALAGQVAKGRMAQGDADAALGRIEIADSTAAFGDCHLVVEAIVEELGAKQKLFRELEGIVAETCILASNTSSLSVTAMAAACAKPGRVAGYHFFNPVPLMKIVEVVDGELTEPWVGEALAALARRYGHTPVRCKDTPGFVVNHAGRGFVPESLRVLQEGVADFATIDRILVDAAGFRMGPFSLMDLVGLDVAHAVMKSMHQQYYGEPKYQPAYIAETRVAAGLLGRKTGRGWYRYDKDNNAQKIPEQPVPAAKPGAVWAAPELKELAGKLGAKLEARPSAEALCLVAPLGTDASTTALELGLDPRRTVAVDPLFGFAKRRTLMTTPVTTREARDAAHALLAADGTPVSVIRDSAGFVAQRVVAHIVNVGCGIVQDRIAHPEDLDRAVMLGLGYPKGPLAMGDAVGPARILAVLEGMHDFYREPRYRPSPWLVRRARLGLSLLTPE